MNYYTLKSRIKALGTQKRIGRKQKGAIPKRNRAKKQKGAIPKRNRAKKQKEVIPKAAG